MDPQPVSPGYYSSQRQNDYRLKWQEWHAKKAELESDPANWRIDEVKTAWDEVYEEVPTVTVTAKPILDGRGFYRSGTRRSVFDKEAPEVDLSGVKSVTYMFVGNIIKLADHLTKEEVLAIARRPVEYPPSWGW
jgi:hypothetical protein